MPACSASLPSSCGRVLTSPAGLLPTPMRPASSDLIAELAWRSTRSGGGRMPTWPYSSSSTATGGCAASVDEA
eukprot:6924263-Alexandrium_andersonii.AAC.1